MPANIIVKRFNEIPETEARAFAGKLASLLGDAENRSYIHDAFAAGAVEFIEAFKNRLFRGSQRAVKNVYRAQHHQEALFAIFAPSSSGTPLQLIGTASFQHAAENQAKGAQSKGERSPDDIMIKAWFDPPRLPKEHWWRRGAVNLTAAAGEMAVVLARLKEEATIAAERTDDPAQRVVLYVPTRDSPMANILSEAAPMAGLHTDGIVQVAERSGDSHSIECVRFAAPLGHTVLEHA